MLKSLLFRPRRSIIESLGVGTVEQAVGVINSSRVALTHERNRDHQIRYLNGDTLREAGAAHGVSGSRASDLINRFLRSLRVERLPRNAETLIFNGLSIAAQNGLTSSTP